MNISFIQEDYTFNNCSKGSTQRSTTICRHKIMQRSQDYCGESPCFVSELYKRNTLFL